MAVFFPLGGEYICHCNGKMTVHNSCTHKVPLRSLCWW